MNKVLPQGLSQDLKNSQDNWTKKICTNLWKCIIYNFPFKIPGLQAYVDGFMLHICPNIHIEVLSTLKSLLEIDILDISYT